MTENEAIKHLQSYAEVVDNMIKYCKDFEPKADITGYLEKKTVFAMAISALKEIQQYREMERKLEEAYGKCDGLLEVVVDNLYLHKGRDIGKPKKATLLTDDSVDMWEAYKQIGTVEECREAVEKLKRAEEALNVILSGNYNDECNFCVHNDNPMANCQCICGDGSWCIHNAKWNGKTSEDENL